MFKGVFMVGNFMFLDDSISLFGNYSFVGIVLSAIILLAIFVLIIKNAVVPFFKKRANGFDVSGELNKLPKSTYKRIKKTYFENFRYRRFVRDIIVSNFGVFIVNSHFTLGNITKNDKGQLTTDFEGPIRVLGDFDAENKKTIEKIKKLSHDFDGAKFYSIVAFPNKAVINFDTSDFDGYIGRLNGVSNYILSKKECELSNEQKENMVNSLLKENSRNHQ